MELKDRIISLSNAPGASGFEKEVSKLIKDECSDLGMVEIDKMNNVYLDRKENKAGLDYKIDFNDKKRRIRVMLDAHIDEVSFIVQAVLPNGCLKVLPLGGWVASNIPAHTVDIMTKSGSYIKGVFASRPPHFMSEEEKKKQISIEDIILDIGSTSYEETLERGVYIGAPVVPSVKCTYDQEYDLFLGKAFDCRSGCASLIESLKELKGIDLDVDVFASFASQEEIGERGAMVTVNRIRPDIALVFEGCPADDTFPSKTPAQTRLKKGPMLRHFDCSMITHPGFQRLALDLAEKNGIACQEAVRSGGGTNGGIIHTSGRAVPCIVIGVPVRYAHSHYCYTSLFDHKEAAKLAKVILQELNNELFEKL